VLSHFAEFAVYGFASLQRDFNDQNFSQRQEVTPSLPPTLLFLYFYLTSLPLRKQLFTGITQSLKMDKIQ
jgi:hypothetical protein